MNYVESFNLLGVEAKQIPCIKGDGAPTTTTEGAVGCFYIDTTTGTLYKCTADSDGNYTWLTFEGEKGNPGVDGKDGVIFTPTVSADGTLSWANNGGLTNPEPVNIVANVESIGEVVQTTGDSETAVMSQKAVTNIANTSASIFLTGECAFYKERVSGYTYIKITTGKLTIADKFLGKISFSWDEIITNISASYIATSPKGVEQCIKITDNGTCLVFNVSTKTFTLKTMQTVDGGVEIVLFFDNYGIHGGLLYSEAENVADTQATVVLNPNATLQIEYVSGYQYMKVIDSTNKGNDKFSIYNKRLGALTFTWSQVLADVNTSYVSKAPSETDGTTASFVKLSSNQCLYYNTVVKKFYAGGLNSVDTEIGIVLYYHTYNGSGGVLYEQYVGRLNDLARGEIDNISNTVTKNEAKKIDYDDFLAIALKQSANTATIVENDAGITEVKFKRANETNTSTSHCYFKFDVKPFDTIILEFYGKSSHPDYDPTDSNTGRFEVVFQDKDGNRVGNQYHAYILGKNRCGYHRYGYVVPLGVTKANFNLYTKGGCEVTLHSLNAKVLKDYNFSNRERCGIKYDAHLGLITSAPENTLPAFELVKKAGFSTCISNCNWTKDDVLVCLHNDEIASRTYEKASGNVQDYTYEELQAFDFGYYTSYYKAYKGTRLPKLEDFVKLMASLGVNPIFRLHSDWYTTKTAKAKDYLAQIHSWICKYGFKGKAYVKSFDIRVLNDCYDVMGKDVEYVLDCESLSANAFNYVEQYKTNGVDLTLEFPDAKVYTDTTNPITEEQIENAVVNGVNLSAYTVNNSAVMRDLFLKGVTRFCTDTFSDIVFPIE